MSVLRVFRHEYNALAVARQEYELACQDWEDTIQRFDSRNPVWGQRLDAASLRRRAAWVRYWELTRGY